MVDTLNMATADVDYVTLNSSLTLTPMDNVTCFQVSITADDVPEATEVFSVQISNDGESGVTLSPNETLILIQG